MAAVTVAGMDADTAVMDRTAGTDMGMADCRE